jgi:hypothetical protein
MPDLITNTIRNSTFHYYLNHKIHCQKSICYIPVADNAYCLLLVSATVFVTFVFGMAMWNGIDFKIEIRTSLDLIQTIFEKYIDEILIPAVRIKSHDQEISK